MKLASRTILTVCIWLSLFGFAQAQNNPPTWSPLTNYKVGDLVSYLGITFECIINETTTRPNPHQPVGWKIYYVSSGNVPIPVGPNAACHSLYDAWDYIRSARLAAGASITIVLQSGYREDFTSNFSLDHPYGAQIYIQGDNTGQTVIFDAQTAGFTVDSGHVFGAINGLAITCPLGGTKSNAAIEVSQHAVLTSVLNVTITNFDVGIAAYAAEVDNVSVTSISKFGIGGVLASDHGAQINVTSAITVDGSTSAGAKPPSFGFKALDGGGIHCENCTALNCLSCFLAMNSGSLYCDGSSASAPAASPFGANYDAESKGYISCQNSASAGSLSGYGAGQGSYVDATGSKPTGFGSFGYYCSRGSTILALGASAPQWSDGTSHIITQ